MSFQEFLDAVGKGAGQNEISVRNMSFSLACTQADRSEFNSHVTELIVSEYGSLHGRSVPEGRITDHKKERIEWKFDQMDTNRYIGFVTLFS